jgi:hypothetical protein
MNRPATNPLAEATGRPEKLLALQLGLMNAYNRLAIGFRNPHKAAT